MPLIDLARLRLALGPRAGRFDVDALDVCTSTNAILLERGAAGAPSGTVLVADRQTEGRGRRGRAWSSSPADSLTFSLLWRWNGPPERLSGLSLAVGVALVRGLETLGARGLGLKWPNDLLARDGAAWAKLAGVLVELSADRRGLQVVIGIGLNLRPPAEVDAPAGGLAGLLDALPERHQLLAGLLDALVQVLDRFEAEGFAPFRAEWQARHVWQGQSVRLLDAGASLAEGLCLGVDGDGALLLETPAGVQRHLVGDLSLRLQ